MSSTTRRSLLLLVSTIIFAAQPVHAGFWSDISSAIKDAASSATSAVTGAATSVTDAHDLAYSKLIENIEFQQAIPGVIRPGSPVSFLIQFTATGPQDILTHTERHLLSVVR